MSRVLSGRIDLPDAWNASPCGYEWFLSFTRNDDVSSFVSLSLNIEVGLVFLVPPVHGYVVCARQRHSPRGLHHPREFLERVKGVSHPRGVNDPPIFTLVRGHTGVVAFIEQRCPMHGFGVLQGPLAFVLHDSLWNSQADVSSDPAVVPSVFVSRVLAVAVQCNNLVPQESGCLTSGMGSHGLFFRQSERAFFTQERSEWCFDLFCLFLRSDERQSEVVSVAAVASPAGVRVVRFDRGKALRLLFVCAGSLPLPFLATVAGLSLEPFLCSVRFPSFSSGLVGDQRGFHTPVQSVEQDSGKHGTQDGTLRNPAERSVPLPFLQISRIQKLFDETEKSSVLDMLRQC